jgi:5-hydroxyisourate hydrolase-like protein (transthyretin family)
MSHSERDRFGIGKAVRAAFACALLCTSLTAQKKPTAPQGGYRIAGVVLNQATGEPAQRAVVDLLDEDDDHTIASVITDAEGRFAFEGLPASKHPLRATKRGFRAVMYDDHDGYNTAIVTGPDQDTTHLIFWLTPGSVLHGVVSADGGDPVEGARVMLFRKPRSHSQDDRILQVNTTMTDDTGGYEFGNLSDGDYFVAVAAKPWYATHRTGNAQSDLDVAYPITYFDSATEEASATPIQLTKGARDEADINLHAVPALQITLDAPQAGNVRPLRPQLQQVVFGSAIPAESGGTISHFRGAQEMDGLAPGRYEVMTGDPPHEMEINATESGQIDGDSAAGTVSVTGTLHMPRGAAAPDEAHVFLHPEDGAQSHANLTAMVRNGRFHFDSVAPGTWSVMVEGDGVMLPVMAASPDAAGNLFAVRDRPVNLSVSIAEGTGRIQGFVQKDSKGFGGAMVVLVPKQASNLEALARRDQSDSDGSFSLSDAIPGDYTVVAIEDGWELDWMQPGALARYLPRGQSVTVNEGNSTVHLAGPVVAQPR